MKKDELVQPTAVEPRGVTASGSATRTDPQERSICRIWPAGVSSQPGTTGLTSEKVHITEHRSIAWDDEIELCPDALYLQLTGLSVEELMPGARPVQADA